MTAVDKVEIMTNQKRASRRGMWIVFFIIVVFTSPLWLCGIVYGFEAQRNNRTLREFASHVYTYPLPPETTEISRSSEVGLLFGNGNHCDYFANIQLQTALSQAQIEDYYEDVSVPPAHEGGRAPSLDLEFIETVDDMLIFEVIAADIGYPAGFDWRCR